MAVGKRVARGDLLHKYAEQTAEDRGHLGGTYSGSLRRENSGARGEGKERVARVNPSLLLIQ